MSRIRCFLDRATRGKGTAPPREKLQNTKAVRARRLGKEQNSSRTGMTTLLKVCGAIQNNVFGTVLLRMGLLCRADDCVSNLDCAALRAMTVPKCVSADALFGIIMQLFKLCGAIRNSVHRSIFALRNTYHFSRSRRFFTWFSQFKKHAIYLAKT